MSVIVNINHETGDLSQYTTTVEDSGDLFVASDAALAGTSYGLSCYIDDTTAIYGQKTLASADTAGTIRFRLYIDPNSLTSVNGIEHSIAVLYNSSSAAFFYVYLAYTTVNGFRVRCAILNDSVAGEFSAYYDITDEPHYLEFQVQRATSADANDAWFKMWVDGTLRDTVTGKDLYTRFADFSFIRFGAISGIDVAYNKAYYLDELIVNNDGSEIGPVVTRAALPVYMAQYRQRVN